MLVAYYRRSKKALDPIVLGEKLDFQSSFCSAHQVEMQRQLGLAFSDLIGDDIGVLQLGFRPADELDGLPKTHVLVFRSPVPAMLIGRFTRHGVFLWKSGLMLFVERQLSAVVTGKQHFKMVVFRLQQRLHILFPCTKLVVGIEELFAIEAHLGVCVDAFKHEFHHVFPHDFRIHLEIERIFPRMVGNPQQFLFHSPQVGMGNQTCFIEVFLHHRRHGDRQVLDVQSVARQGPTFVEGLFHDRLAFGASRQSDDQSKE